MGESPEVNSQTRGALWVGNWGVGVGAEAPFAIAKIQRLFCAPDGHGDSLVMPQRSCCTLFRQHKR